MLDAQPACQAASCWLPRCCLVCHAQLPTASLLQVRYWKTNLELVKSVSAHREAVRQLSFAPSDLKYATGSDDSTIRVSWGGGGGG